MTQENTIKTVLAIFIVLALNACWFPCAPAICGTVKDKTSGEKIDSVKVDVYEAGELLETVYSDTTGFFQTGAKPKSVFMFSSCEREFRLVFKKPGYIEKIHAGTAPAVNIVIELEK